jgi:ligand-binding sensor domain-containing protein
VSCWTTNATQDFAVGQYSNAWTVLVDRQQRVWTGTLGEGLFQLQDGHFQPAPGAETLGSQIFALFESRDGQLWAGTQNGLASYDGQKWKLFTTLDGLSENAVRAIAEDAAGNLWVGTESHGLNFFKDGKFAAYRADENGLPGDDISCLYADKDGSCGSAPAATDWPGFKTEAGRVMPPRTASPATASVTSSKTIRAACGSARTPG